MSENVMKNGTDVEAQLDRWLDEAGTDPSERAKAARSSLVINAAWQPVLFGAGALGGTVAGKLR